MRLSNAVVVWIPTSGGVCGGGGVGEMDGGVGWSGVGDSSVQ